MREKLRDVMREIEIEIDGQIVSSEEKVGEIIKASPNKILVNNEWIINTEKVGEYIRLNLENEYYLWNDDIINFNETVSDDPISENRWEIENG